MTITDIFLTSSYHKYHEYFLNILFLYMCALETKYWQNGQKKTLHIPRYWVWLDWLINSLFYLCVLTDYYSKHFPIACDTGENNNKHWLLSKIENSYVNKWLHILISDFILKHIWCAKTIEFCDKRGAILKRQSRSRYLGEASMKCQNEPWKSLEGKHFSKGRTPGAVPRWRGAWLVWKSARRLWWLQQIWATLGDEV